MTLGSTTSRRRQPTSICHAGIRQGVCATIHSSAAAAAPLHSPGMFRGMCLPLSGVGCSPHSIACVRSQQEPPQLTIAEHACTAHLFHDSSSHSRASRTGGSARSCVQSRARKARASIPPRVASRQLKLPWSGSWSCTTRKLRPLPSSVLEAHLRACVCCSGSCCTVSTSYQLMHDIAHPFKNASSARERCSGVARQGYMGWETGWCCTGRTCR